MSNPENAGRATVALIAGQLGLGGAEQQLYHLVAGMDRAVFDPLVISLAARPGEYWEAPIARLKVPVVHVPQSSGRGRRFMRIAAILRSARVDVVHAWAFHANPYAALAGRLAGVPVRVGSMRESYAGLPLNRIWRWAGVRGLNRLVTNSHANAQALRRHVSNPDRVHVVPNGTVVPAEMGAAERQALKTELGVASGDHIIGTVGRVDRNKNHALLLRAFALIAGRWPRTHLVIIGDGPLLPEVAEEAAQLGLASRVHLLGSRPGAARYVPAFDVCCLTSNTEGMPNLLMEASAAGVPVIATDCGGTRDVIEHAVTGYLVRPGDADALAAHMSRILESPDLASGLGQAGRTRMHQEFSVDAMVARMSELYLRELASHIPHHKYSGTAHGTA